MSNTKKKLRPISHYLGDRKRMFQEMFNSIPLNQLPSLIPPELQCMPLGELKAELLILLLQMPEKDIIDAMEGRKVVANVTLSDDEDADPKVVVLSDEDRKSKTQNITKSEVLSDDEDVLEINIEESEMKEIERSYQKVKLERKGGQNRKRKRPKKENDSESDEENTHRNKSLLELLELEFRAKAIRSLLRKEQEQAKHEEQLKNNESNDLEVVSSDEDDVIPVEEALPEIELSSGSEEDDGDKEASVVTVESHEGDTDNNDGVNDSVQVVEVEATNGREATDVPEQSWQDRWLHSESVKQVVATSKMLTTVRKKILSKSKEKRRRENSKGDEGSRSTESDAIGHKEVVRDGQRDQLPTSLDASLVTTETTRLASDSSKLSLHAPEPKEITTDAAFEDVPLPPTNGNFPGEEMEIPLSKDV